MIAIIDYGGGNLKSVKNALDFLGCESVITDDPAVVEKAEKIIFPGQGNFKDVMEGLEKRNLIEPLQKILTDKAGKPFLGICVGLQVLFESSEENPGVPGLSIFKGTCKKFESDTLKIPQMGWNALAINQDNPKSTVLQNIKENAYVYFIHSYYVDPQDADIILTEATYANQFVSGVAKDNIVAFQFHPERSGEIGLQILKNFCEGK